MTSNDNKTTSEDGGQEKRKDPKRNMKKSQILVPVLISGEPASEGFSGLSWKNELQSYLPFHHKIVSPDSEQILLPTLLNSTKERLSSLINQKETHLTNKNSPKISFPSFMSSQLGVWVKDAMDKQKENLKKPTNLLLAAKVRLKPTKIQRAKLKEWFGAVRWTYNKSIEMLKNGDFKDCNGKLEYTVRNKLVTYKGNEDTLPAWIPSIPKDVRMSGTDEASVAWKTFGSSSMFNFRRKKSKHQCFSLPGWSVSTIKGRDNILKIYSKTLGQVKCNKSMLRKVLKKNILKKDKSYLAHDAKISFNGTHYYLHIPYEPKINKEKEYSNIVGLDPGVRSFVTGFSVSNEKETIIDYQTRRQKIHLLREQIRNATSKKKKWKYENQLKDQITSTHIAVAKDLTSKFSDLVIGKFDSQKLTEKQGSKLSKNTRIEIGALSHYKFRDRLILESIKSGCRLQVIPEHFTSKTCGVCGEVNHTLGSKKIFECKECNSVFDRDVNAARNMIIKFLVASKV